MAGALSFGCGRIAPGRWVTAASYGFGQFLVGDQGLIMGLLVFSDGNLAETGFVLT